MADNEFAIKITADASSVQEGVDQAKEQIEKASESVSMLGDLIGVKVPEGVQKMLAQTELIGPALTAAFQPIAILALAQVVVEVIGKIGELIKSTEELSKEEKKRHDEFMQQSAEELRHQETLIRGAYELRAAQADTDVDRQAIRVEMAAALVNLDQKHIEELQAEKKHFDDLANSSKTYASELHKSAAEANYDMEQGADLAEAYAGHQERIAESYTKQAEQVQRAIDEANAAMQRHQADQINDQRSLNTIVAAQKELNAQGVITLNNLHARSAIAGMLAAQQQERNQDDQNAANALTRLQEQQTKSAEKLLAVWDEQSKHATKIAELTAQIEDGQAQHNARMAVALGYMTEEQAAQKTLVQLEKDKQALLGPINERLTEQIAIVKKLGDETMNGMLGSPQQKAAYQKAVTDYQNLKVQQLEVEKRYDGLIAREQEKLTQTFAAQIRKLALQWQDIDKQLGQTFMSTLNSMNQNLSTFIVEGKANWQQFASTVIEEIVRIALQWVESQIMMALFGQTQQENEMSAVGAKNAGTIMSASFVAAANAYAANAAFPPIAAAAASTAMGAVQAMIGPSITAALTGLKSAAGGQWIVPSTQLTILHPQEMVLPAGPAQGLRNMLETPSGGHTFNISYTINAMDGNSVKAVYDRHLRWRMKRDIMAALKPRS